MREDLNFLAIGIECLVLLLARRRTPSNPESFAGSSTNGGEVAPMLEISASAGDFPVVPAISRSILILEGGQRFLDNLSGSSSDSGKMDASRLEEDAE